MVGFGYDVHRLAKGESLILGGITIDSDFGTVAHSDGDVLLHSIIDALMGAAGLGDIGEHFPDTSEEFRGISSVELMNRTMVMLEDMNYKIVNIDATINVEKPKLKEYKPLIKNNIAKLCGLPENRVNIKATTNEKMGFTGNGEGIAVYAVCMLSS